MQKGREKDGNKEFRHPIHIDCLQFLFLNNLGDIGLYQYEYGSLLPSGFLPDAMNAHILNVSKFFLSFKTQVFVNVNC